MSFNPDSNNWSLAAVANAPFATGPIASAATQAAEDRVIATNSDAAIGKQAVADKSSPSLVALAEELRALRTYIVQPRDNPSSIGIKFFGDARAGAFILADNGLNASVPVTRSLPVGTVLTLRDGISNANLRAGGRLIGADTFIRAQETASVVQAQAEADQARYDAMQMGVGSGRTSQVSARSQVSGPAMVSQAVYTPMMRSALGSTAQIR